MSLCLGQFWRTDLMPLLSPPSHCWLQQREWINDCQGAPQEQQIPWGSAQSLWGALGWVEKKPRKRPFLRAAITHRRCWNEMMNVNVGLAGKWQRLTVNVGLLAREATLWGLRQGRWGRKGVELSKQEVELWPVFSSLPTLQCLFAAGAY